MSLIDDAARLDGPPPKEHMTMKEANTCYNRGEKVIFAAMSNKTKCGRPRIVARASWGTVLKRFIVRRNKYIEFVIGQQLFFYQCLSEINVMNFTNVFVKIFSH